MSLPSAFLDEIDALNREVLKYKPADVLQFCANYFNHRLESQRAEFVLSASSNSRFSSSSAFGTMSGSSGYNGGESRFPGSLGGSGLGLGMSSFDGSRESPFAGIREEEEDAGQSPTTTSFRSNVMGGRNSAQPQGGLFGGPFSRSDAPQNSSSPNPPPPPNSGFLGVPGSGDFPSDYNRNRRTSVSAESLAPSASSDEWKPPFYSKTPEQLNRLKTAVSNNFLFMHLEEEQSAQVLGALMEKPIPAKDTRIITQGDAGDYFYIVEEGSFDIYVNPAGSMLPGPNGMGNRVNQIGPGGSFGELALMYNAPRAATIISTTPHNILWALDRVTFRRILMENTYKRRRLYEDFLEEVPILADLVPYERSKIADALDTLTYVPGSTIIKEGDPGENFYIIESGTADVYKSGIQDPVKTYGKGDYFGELALLNDAPRAASVVARTKVKVATLSNDGFQRLLGPATEIMRRNDPRLKAEGVDPLAGNGNSRPSDGPNRYDGAMDVVQEASGRGRAVEV